MKLGIMQPYFFPYIGYFHLIDRVDQWVVFDVVNYKKKSWMNRNRIHHPNKGWQYISFPVEKTSMGTKIKDVQGKERDKAREKLVAQLDFFRKKAPYTDLAIDVVNDTFNRSASHKLVDVCVSGLLVVAERLGIEFDYSIMSELNLSLPSISHAGQWALEISKERGATEYINPIGGQEIFEVDEFRKHNIEFTFSDPAVVQYDVTPFGFEPNLSILDMMCWLSPGEIRSKLDSL